MNNVTRGIPLDCVSNVLQLVGVFFVCLMDAPKLQDLEVCHSWEILGIYLAIFQSLATVSKTGLEFNNNVHSYYLALLVHVY